MSHWKRRVQFWELCWYFPAETQFFNKLLIKTPLDYWKIIKLFFFLSKSFLLKKLLWTEKNTTLRIGWKIFAKVQKSPNQGLKNVEDNRSPKRDRFLDKTLLRRRIAFFPPSWSFHAHCTVFLPKFYKIFLEFRKNFPNCLFFWWKKHSSRKRFSCHRHIKTQICRWC